MDGRLLNTHPVAFIDERRRTVSDDGLLVEHLQATTVRRTHVVPVGGTFERTVRWTKIIRRHDPGAIWEDRRYRWRSKFDVEIVE